MYHNDFKGVKERLPCGSHSSRPVVLSSLPLFVGCFRKGVAAYCRKYEDYQSECAWQKVRPSALSPHPDLVQLVLSERQRYRERCGHEFVT